MVSLIDGDRQFFKSQYGLAEPWATRRETPLTHSFCQHTVNSGEPFVVNDARDHALVRDNKAIRTSEILEDLAEGVRSTVALRAALADVGRRLQREVRGKDVLGRLDGGAYCMLCTDLAKS